MQLKKKQPGVACCYVPSCALRRRRICDIQRPSSRRMLLLSSVIVIRIDVTTPRDSHARHYRRHAILLTLAKSQAGDRTRTSDQRICEQGTSAQQVTNSH